jgi:hypothetical protein
MGVYWAVLWFQTSSRSEGEWKISPRTTFSSTKETIGSKKRRQGKGKRNKQ